MIISHFHGDHVNGLLDADNTLAFPNAEILVPAAEHKFLMDDGEMSRAPAGRMDGLFKNDRRVLTRGRAEAHQALRAGQGDRAGHHRGRRPTAIRSGHNSHVVASGKSKVFVQADVTHVPLLFARNPDWHAFYDQDRRRRKRRAARSTTCWSPTG